MLNSALMLEFDCVKAHRHQSHLVFIALKQTLKIYSQMKRAAAE